MLKIDKTLIRDTINKNIIPLRSTSSNFNISDLSISSKKECEIDTDIENPFLYMRPFPFLDVNSYIMASIDLHFNITHFSFGILAPNLLRYQNYVIVSNQKQSKEVLSFIEYIQYRNALTFIYDLVGVNVPPKSLIFPERVYPIIKGNYKDYKFYIDKIKNVDYEGLDVFISQGYSDRIDLFYQIMILLNILKNSADCVIRIDIKDDQLVHDILKVLTTVFTETFLFKDFINNISNDIYYVIGKKYNAINSPLVIKTLKEYFTNPMDQLFSKNDQTILDYINKIKNIIDKEKDLKGLLVVPARCKIYLEIE